MRANNNDLQAMTDVMVVERPRIQTKEMMGLVSTGVYSSLNTVKTVKEYKIHYDSSLSSANSSQFHTIKPHATQLIT